MTRPKRPDVLEKAEKAYTTLDNEVSEVVYTMSRWPEVRTAVLRWIDGTTTTNCGWGEYGLAQQIASRWQTECRNKR